MNRRNTSKEGHFSPPLPPSSLQITSSSEARQLHPNSSTTTPALSSNISGRSADALNLAVELLNSLASYQSDGFVSPQQQARGYHTNETGLQTLSRQLIALAAASGGPPDTPLSSPPFAMPTNGQHTTNKGENTITPTTPTTSSLTDHVPVTRGLIELLSSVSGTSRPSRPGQLSDDSANELSQLTSWDARLPSSVATPSAITAFQNAISQLTLLGLSSPVSPSTQSLGARSGKRSGGAESQLSLPLESGLPSTIDAGLTRFPLRSDGTKVVEVELNNHNGQCQPMDVTQSNAMPATKELVGSKVIIRQTADADDHFFKALRRLKVDASPELKQVEAKRSLEQVVSPAALARQCSKQALVEDGKSAAELAVDEHFKKSLAAFRDSSHSVPSPSPSSSSSSASVVSLHTSAASAATKSPPCTLPLVSSLSLTSSELPSTDLHLLLKTISSTLNTSGNMSLTDDITQIMPSVNNSHVNKNLMSSHLSEMEVTRNWSKSFTVPINTHGEDKVTNRRDNENTFTREMLTNILGPDSETLMQNVHSGNGTSITRLKHTSTSLGVDNTTGVIHSNLEKKSSASSPSGQTSTAHSFKPKKNWLAQYDVCEDDHNYQITDTKSSTDHINHHNFTADSYGSYVDGTETKGRSAPGAQYAELHHITNQQKVLAAAPQWSQIDVDETASICSVHQHEEKKRSFLTPPSSPGCSPILSCSKISEFELKTAPVTEQVRQQKQGQQQPALQQSSCRPNNHNANRMATTQRQRHRTSRYSHQASDTKTRINDTSPPPTSLSTSPRISRDKKTADCATESDGINHRLLPLTTITKSVSFGNSPHRHQLTSYETDGTKATSSVSPVVTHENAIQPNLEVHLPTVTTCGNMSVNVHNSIVQHTHSNLVHQPALSHSENLPCLTSELREKGQFISDVARSGKLSSRLIQVSTVSPTPTSYWTRSNTSPPQSFSSSPSSVLREGSATTTATPISEITSGFFSGSTYSLDSSLGAAHMLVFDNITDTKLTSSGGESKATALHTVFHHSKDNRSQHATHDAKNNLPEDDECGDFFHLQNQSNSQTNCVWRKRASSEVSPWLTLKRSRSVITSSSSSGEKYAPCECPSREQLTDEGKTLLPVTSALLGTPNRHSMSELTCSTNHSGRPNTPPEYSVPSRLSSQDCLVYSHGHLSEACDEPETDVKSLERQALFPTFCRLRRDSIQSKASSAPSAISAPQSPSTTVAVSIARSLSDTATLSAFHVSHEEPIHMLR